MRKLILIPLTILAFTPSVPADEGGFVKHLEHLGPLGVLALPALPAVPAVDQTVVDVVAVDGHERCLVVVGQPDAARERTPQATMLVDDIT